MAEKSELEKQMEALMGSVGNITEGAKSAAKDASAIRRKSRELGEVFDALDCEQWAGLTSLLGEDKSDAAIEKLFKEIGLCHILRCPRFVPSLLFLQPALSARRTLRRSG